MTTLLRRRSLLASVAPVPFTAGGAASVIDAVQEWWCYPESTYVSSLNATFVGAVSATGEILACALDHGGGASRRYVVGQATVDDHNRPALYASPGRRLVTLWSNHNADAVLHCKVGAVLSSISDLGSLVGATDQPNTANLVSYNQMFRVASLSDAGTDTFIVFSRTFLASAWSWRFRTLAVDQATGTATWGTLTNLFAGSGTQQLYMKAVPGSADEQKLRIGLTYNPASTIGDVYYVELNLASGDITNASTGAVLDNIWTPVALPLAAGSLPAVLTSSTEDTRICAVRAYPEAAAMLVAVWGTSSSNLRHYELAAGAWSFTDFGTPGQVVGSLSQRRYIGGGAYPNPSTPDKLYIARGIAGTWTVERWTKSAGTWSSEILRQAGAHKLARPEFPRNGASSPYDVIVNNLSRYNEYTDYAGDLMALTTLPTPTVAPVNTAAPVASTPGVVIAGRVVSVTNGDWDNQPITAFAYQWTRNGGDIAGAASATYTLQVADEGGAVIACKVTATNVVGSTTISSAALVSEVQPVAAYADVFTEASDTALTSHTSDTGHTYTRPVGANPQVVTSVSPGTLRSPTVATETVTVANWTPASADYTVHARWVPKSALTGMRLGLRVQAASGDGYFAVWRPDTNVYQFQKRVGGVATQLGSDITPVGNGVGSGSSSRYVIFDVQGSTLRMSVVVSSISLSTSEITAQATPQGSIEDTSITAAGSVGFWNTASAGSNTTRLHIDDVRAFDKPVGP